MTLPNFITIVRFLLVPFIIFAMIDGQMGLALALFAAAGLSDGVDGFIARRFNQKSELGAWLDPLADKLMLVSVFLVLGWMGALPVWLVLLAVSRDAMIVGAVLLSSVMGYPVEARPLFVSKANTAAQIVLVIAVMAKLAGFTLFEPVVGALIAVTAGLTAASAAAYLVVWLKQMAGPARA